MFHPLSIYVGLRYVRARSHEFFVSFITWASLIGVCVGVAALIVILSVMNGFESELRDRLLSLSAQVRITEAAPAGAAVPILSAAQWQQAAATAATAAGVTDVTRYAELQALAVRQPEMVPVLLRGIDPNAAASKGELGKVIAQGQLADLTAGSARVIVGAIIAERLGLAVGDALTVLVPTVNDDGAPAPKLREFTVAGVFEVGLQDHDGTLVFANLEDVRSLGAEGTASEGLRVRVRDVLAAPSVAASLRQAAAGDSRGQGLDPGQRQLFPRDPHREDHDVADPADDRGGRRLQHRGDAGHGGHRQAHRHCHRAHLRGRATGASWRSSSPRDW